MPSPPPASRVSTRTNSLKHLFYDFLGYGSGSGFAIGCRARSDATYVANVPSVGLVPSVNVGREAAGARRNGQRGCEARWAERHRAELAASTPGRA